LLFELSIGQVESIVTVQLPVNYRRGDISVFEVRNDVVLSHRFKFNGCAGDANAFAERLFGIAGASRSWNTVSGLVRKYAVTTVGRPL
jgi:hypothetical protein